MRNANNSTISNFVHVVPFVIFSFFLFFKELSIAVISLSILGALYAIMTIINFRKNFFHYFGITTIYVFLTIVLITIHSFYSKSIALKVNEVNNSLLELACTTKNLETTAWTQEVVKSGLASRRVLYREIGGYKEIRNPKNVFFRDLTIKSLCK